MRLDGDLRQNRSAKEGPRKEDQLYGNDDELLVHESAAPEAPA
jgi:hypothetical protein